MYSGQIHAATYNIYFFHKRFLLTPNFWKVVHIHTSSSLGHKPLYVCVSNVCEHVRWAQWKERVRTLSRDRNTMGDMSRAEESGEVFRFFQISAGHLHLQHFIWVNLLEKNALKIWLLFANKKKRNFLHFILVQCIWKQGVILAPVDHVSLFENLCKDKHINLTWLKFKFKGGSTDKYTFLFLFLYFHI